MKKTLIFLLLTIFGLSIAFVYKQPLITFTHSLTYFSPCNTPITYKIGQVDPQFNLTSDKFAYNVKEAADVWNNIENKPLLKYDPNGLLTISLLFDGRQQISNQISNLNSQLQNEKNALDPKITQYNTLSQQFQSQLDQFKSEADYWNKKGGAPPDEYQKLLSQQKFLQDQSTTLNQMAKDLNLSTSQYNGNITQLNQTIQNYNVDLQFKPEEGIYDPKNNSIILYFNNSHTELIHTLAHELGHALGLEHNPNPRSIMYYQTSQIILPTSDDLTALQAICQERSIIFLLEKRIATIKQTLTHSQ